MERDDPTPAPLPGERRVIDALPASLPLSESESAWLLTLLSADELRFIFEGPADGDATY